MKPMLGWTTSWALYWLGDMTYRAFGNCPLYHLFMDFSIDVQQWSGSGPWPPDDDSTDYEGA